MSDEVRVVIDTNVFVSFLTSPNSIPHRAVELAFRNATVLVSQETLAELDEVLHRPKFSRYFSLRDAASILDRLVREAVFVAVPLTIRRSRDPKDDAFLDLAVEGRARWLVTGDGDLLMLKAVEGVRIVTPATFVAAFDG